MKIAAYFLGVVALWIALNECTRTINTLNALEAIEIERDGWQRPADVMRALDAADGRVVADIGSGAGYFALKLARRVGARGQVLAVDVQRGQLAFLWIRALMRRDRNLHVRLGAPDDPRLPAGRLDSALVANTYHELANPDAMLRHLRKSLRGGGRLVVLDRSEASGRAHEISADVVESALRREGFEIAGRQNEFICRPDGERWWLIVATKP